MAVKMHHPPSKREANFSPERAPLAKSPRGAEL